MKRYGYLFEQVITFENLLLATQKASQGKKDKLRVAHFLFHLEKEILTLQEELQTGHWQPSDYYIFEIREPKPRRISATDFRDRVVHHAICHILDPIFEQQLIYDCWACRKGKGTHAAIKRAQYFSRRYPYFLKCDIRHYFQNIDHEILKQLLHKLIKDARLLKLLHQIIDHPLPGSLPNKSIPIGNLTSQHFANLYLGKLDHELKEQQKVKGYVRYMDDMLLFAQNKNELHRLQHQLEDFISHKLALRLKPSATILAPVSEGIPFLGFRIFPQLIRLNQHTLQRFRRRKRMYEHAYQCGKIDMATLSISVQSMIAHIQHANTRRLQQSLLMPSLPLG
ncbi:MAG: RNA-directed DNA polymerase, partial [Thiomargarita sp.]|nr:RNA-directed DNA polymerase [Thiomargarita sp.]